MKQISLLTLTLTFFISFLIQTSAQTSAAFEREAIRLKAEGNYYGAKENYGRMLQIDSSDSRALEGYADCARLYFLLDEAEATYQKIFDGKAKVKDPRAMFWLASIKQDNGKYNEAITLYNQFIAAPMGVDSGYVAIAKQQIARCNYNIGHAGDPDPDIEIAALPEPINSEKGEYAPILQGDKLYFSSNRDEWKNDPIYHERDQWKVFTNTTTATSSETVAATFNEKELGTANTTFSKDGYTMYYTVLNYVGKTARFESRLYRREKGADGEWTNPQLLPEPVNAPVGSNTTEPSVGWDASGNETLYFVSDRPGGKGGKDIYSCAILKDNGFSNVENLEAINTAGDDITPNWHTATNTLYFATDGRASLGGLDIYKSEKKGLGWLAPVHLPTPVNSNYNDAYYWLMPNETAAYFCSNRKNASTKNLTACCYDIYKADFLGIELVAVNFNKILKDSLTQTTMRLIDLNEKGKGDEMKVQVVGNHQSFPIERNHKYMLITDKTDFTSDTVYVDTWNLKERKIVKNLFLQPAIVDLTALVFDKETGEKLTGTTMRFEEITGSRKEDKANATGNDYFYTLNFEKKYRLIACKEGYTCDTAYVSTQGFDRTQTKHLTEKLYLKPVSIESYLPLSLFFDNDEPDKRTMATKTNRTYGATYHIYYDERKATFLEEWQKWLATQQSQQTGISMAQFFQDSVKRGFDNLELVCKALEKRLSNGESVILEIQGFASKRATGPYNKALTSRRIWSVKNHFAAYGTGILKKYMDEKRLTFKEIPQGESTSLETADYEDIKNELKTIYTVRSSRERRVYIRNFIFTAGQNPSQQQPSSQFPSQQSTTRQRN